METPVKQPVLLFFRIPEVTTPAFTARMSEAARLLERYDYTFLDGPVIAINPPCPPPEVLAAEFAAVLGEGNVAADWLMNRLVEVSPQGTPAINARPGRSPEPPQA